MILACLVVLALVGVLIVQRSLSSNQRVTPIPGPKTYSIFGNGRQLGRRPQSQLKKWAKEYGEIFQLRLGTERWVFVNSLEAVRSIFDKQASLTSSKKPMPVVFGLISGYMRFFLMPTGHQWRILRTVIQAQLTPLKSDTYQADQEIEARQLTHDILTDNKDQKNFYTHVRRYTMSGMMRTTYGTNICTSDNDQMHEIYQILQDFSEITSTRPYIADTFPLLTMLPLWGQWWRKGALVQQERQTNVWMKYWTDLEWRVKEKRAKECLAKRWLEIDGSLPRTESITRKQWAYFAGTMIEAGSESQSAVLNDCLKHLAANPEVQFQAHEELFRVVGCSRSPILADKPHCPYTRACIKEILRLVPSTSNGIAHYTTNDIFYKDYHIPKNTVVSINLWALSHDESRYEAPEMFRPERYANGTKSEQQQANIRIQPYGPDRFIWGGGRRICPGIYLADNSLFIALAKILWAFEIRPPLNEMGRESEVDTSEESYEEGRISIPKPFGLRFISRGKEFENKIMAERGEDCL